MYLSRSSSFIVLASFLLLNAYAAPVPDITDTIKKTFKVKEGGTLFVDIDRGNIEIRIGDGDAVMIEVERSVDVETRDMAKRLLDNHELEISQDHNDVLVRSRFRQDGRQWMKWRQHEPFAIRVRVYVPQRFNVDFSTDAGNVDVADVVGYVEGRSGAGNIRIGFVAENVDISTGSGNIEIGGAMDGADVVSGAGNIVIHDVVGEIRATTGAGNVTANISRQPDGDARLETGAGNVTVFLGSNVAVNASGITKVGSCSTDFPIAVEGSWMKKYFSGVVNGGGPDLRMKSGVGNVSLKKL